MASLSESVPSCSDSGHQQDTVVTLNVCSKPEVEKAQPTLAGTIMAKIKISIVTHRFIQQELGGTKLPSCLPRLELLVHLFTVDGI